MYPGNISPMSFQARHNGQNYVFALLTGYHDPPAGVSVISILGFILKKKTNVDMKVYIFI